MGVNVKGGFNRLYIVLAVVWAFYCLVVYPMQRRDEAFMQWQQDIKMCQSSDVEMGECFKLAEQNWRTTTEPWFLRRFYIWAWWLLLLAIVVFPLVVYGCCRGAAAVGAWVWRGFRVKSP